jgi:selenide,water dikinase
MHPVNKQAISALECTAPVDDDRLQILFDPQTSGGLLIGVAADRAQALRDELRDGGYGQAEIIGQVIARSAGAAGSVFVS